MGKAIPGSYVTVIDEDGNPAQPNEIGNIAVPLDLPALFKGYYKDEARTANPQIGEYFITGDLAKWTRTVISGLKVEEMILSLVLAILSDHLK